MKPAFFLAVRVFVFTCFIFLQTLVYAQVKLPERVIGNWVNVKTNNWEYGLFEKFAIYKSAFWEYEFINAHKNQLEIKLKKGAERETLKLTIPKKAGKGLAIGRGKEKIEQFKLHQTGFSPYPVSDHKTFKNSNFKTDTVTIIGYYQNLTKFNKEAVLDVQKGPFKVSVPNFITGKTIHYYADFDSLGRFKIKFPVLNTQEIYIDGGRLFQSDVVEPGETTFLFADMDDYLLTQSELNQEGLDKFRLKPREILYMGGEARLHNEIANYRFADVHLDKPETARESTSDLGYMNTINTNYEIRKQHLKDFIKVHPTLSDRFKEYQFTFEKYQMASKLMQYRFYKRETGNPEFEKGYMEFVDNTMDFNNNMLFTLVHYYSIFVEDFVGYKSDIKELFKNPETGRGISVSDPEVLLSLKNDELTKEEKAVLAEFITLIKDVFPEAQKIKDKEQATEFMKPYQQVMAAYNKIIQRPDLQKALPGFRVELLSQKRFEAKLKHIDTLFQNTQLKELLFARSFYQNMDNVRVPLSKDLLATINSKITHPTIKDYILGVNKHYIVVNNKSISYLASLKNTEHLKEAKDADLLFKELIAPYKGKVIYIDFWGTWCGPCREQMPFTGVVKKEFSGKDVVFMYLANNSPEISWKNVIKEMDLTGENVVHYRLPSEQQALVERKFAVNSFPSYLLIGKDGNLAQDDAPRPEMKEQLVQAINNLLKQ